MVSFDMQLSVAFHQRAISFRLRWWHVSRFMLRIDTRGHQLCTSFAATTPPPQTPLRNYAIRCVTERYTCAVSRLFGKNVTRLPDGLGHFGNDVNP